MSDRSLIQSIFSPLVGITVSIRRANYISMFYDTYALTRDLLLASKDYVVRYYQYWRMGALFMWRDKEYSIIKKADFANLKELREFTSKYCSRGGLNKKRVSNVQLAVDEVVTNVIRHAYKDREQGNVNISVVRSESHVDVICRDRGVEFDWNLVLNPDLKKYVQVKRKGGLGIMLIRKLTDKADYQRLGDVNQVTMTFNLNLEERRELFKKLIIDIRNRFTITTQFFFFSALALSILLISSFGYIENRIGKVARKSGFIKGVDTALNIAASSALQVIEKDELILNEFIRAAKEQVKGTAYVTILNKNGFIIADTDSTRLFTSFVQLPFVREKPLSFMNSKIWTVIHNEKITYDIEVDVFFGTEQVGVVHLGIYKSKLDSLRDAGGERIERVGIAFSVFFFGVLVIITLIHLFVRPLKDFSDAVMNIGELDFDMERLKVSRLAEFQEIENALTKMTSRLQGAEAQLTDQTRISREMELAKDIQDAILPSEAPAVTGFTVDGRYRSAVEMGGDYYDYFPVNKDAVGLAIGDVSGKGIGAAFIMSIARMAIRSEAKGIRRASDVMIKVDNLINKDIKKGMYITVYYAVLDGLKRTINYASAGHNPMILYRAKEKETYFLNPKGVAIGLDLPPKFFKENITSESVTLRQGDLVFMYTDGINEAMNPKREEYGDVRLVEFIKKNHHLSVDEFCLALDQDIEEFVQGYPQTDDITYIVIKSKPTEAETKYNKVLQLFELIEEKGKDEEEACEEVGFTEDEFEEIMETVESKGIEAYIPPETEEEVVDISHATLAQAKKILRIVRRNPAFGVRKIQLELEKEEYGNEKISANLIQKELKKQKLLKKEARIRFSERQISNISIFADIDD